MGASRSMPTRNKAEIFVGLQPQVLNRQIALRDEALDADPGFSGIALRLIEQTWINWLPKTVAKPSYRDQLTTHFTELEHQIDNLSREIELQPKRPKSLSKQQQ